MNNEVLNEKKKCIFCGKDTNLTKHHIIAKKYYGEDSPENLMKNVCRNCHDDIEDGINKNRAQAGAGNPVPQNQEFSIGSSGANLVTGSSILNEKGTTFLDVDAPIYGVSCHNKSVGEKYLELSLSGAKCVVINGSPSGSWVIYSIAKSF